MLVKIEWTKYTRTLQNLHAKIKLKQNLFKRKLNMHLKLISKKKFKKIEITYFIFIYLFIYFSKIKTNLELMLEPKLSCDLNCHFCVANSFLNFQDIPTDYWNIFYGFYNFFFIWFFFREHSRFTGQYRKREAISFISLYHFSSLHRYLDVRLAITSDSSLLHIARSWTQTGSASRW